MSHSNSAAIYQWLARLVLGAGAVFATIPTAARAQAAVPPAINDLMQDRKYDEAVTAIDKLLADKKDPADQLLYLKGRALHLKGDFDGASATFELLATTMPKSALARKARFAKAVAHARKGDYRAAELIYKSEAQHVLSLARKQEIASIYLEFADGYFKPAKADVAPDYAKALEFYVKALEVGPQPDKKIELELRIAECKQQLGQHAEAAQLLAKFLKDHPQHALAIEARFRLGECLMSQAQPVEARRTWQDLLQLHADAKSERLPEAAYRLSETYGLPNPLHSEDLSLGVAALQAFLEKYPEHKLAGAAHDRIVQSYLARGRIEDAITAAKKFLADERYAKRDEVPSVRILLGRAYQSQGKFDEALAAYAEFLAKHPTHPSWAQAQLEIINVEFAKARTAFDAKNYGQARDLWTQFLAKYPLDGRSASILYRFGQMKFREEKWDEAIAAWRQLVSKYPGTNESSQAQLMIAVTLEDKLRQYEEALKEYQKLNWGNMVSAARQRVNRLTAKAMTIATERTFRSGETPVVNLRSRNVDAVTVRVYTVDLETYFRKMHLASGIEQLDISLIDPDATFEFKVPDYQPHQEFTSQIQVPLPKQGDAKASGGVMAVTVSSKTLEATTLVLQSDLDIIVKSSRDEVFVFAQNLKTKQPWANARILVSDGNQVFAEGTTGADGVLHKSYKELAAAADVRVFAVADRNTASNVVGLSGVGVSEGLTDKGYIYTDRPAYRAGQIVHIRGVLRKVAGDRYTVAQGKAYKVDVFDNRNRLVADAEVTLSAFGSFHAHAKLPLVAPAGEYRILVHDNDKESYEGSFVVHEYQLEPVRIEVVSDRTVYYRGEEITGTIKAAYYYGAPLIGKEIRYRLAEGRTETATTNEKGEVTFRLPTRDYRESQTLNLIVELPERNVSTGKNFFLSTQGFTLEAKSIRPVYLAGESFEATVLCKDAEQKPLAQTLTLQVLKRTDIDGKTGEREVAKFELKSDAKEGIVRKALRLDEGGEYILRAAGVDRFQNTITHETTVRISDDKDGTRLRILADRHTFKVGDTAQVVVHWREEAALALVTYQGAKILDYKLVQLQPGANKLEIPLTAALAPNFELAVAVMTDARQDPKAKPDEHGNLPFVRRFHETASPIAVQRDLNVKIEYQRAGAKPDDPRPLAPGDDVDVTITTTDVQGKPLSAEVSLAMIEQALLEQFSWQVDSIAAFFRDKERVSAMRTTSSIVFHYHPATRPINPHLLAEKDRLDVAEEEKRRLEEIAVAPAPEPAVEAIAGEEFRLDPLSTDAIANDSDAATVQVELEDATTGARFQNRSNSGIHLGAIEQRLAQQDEAADEYNAWSQAGGAGLAGRAGAQSRIIRSAGGVAANRPAGQPSANGSGQVQMGFGFHDMPAQDWKDRGFGIGRVQDFPTNLSLVVTDGTQFSDNRWMAQLHHADVRSIQVLERNGKVVTYNVPRQLGVEFHPQVAADFIAKVNKDGAMLLPAFGAQETGYWNPAIATDGKGTAKLTITLPHRSTAWTLIARAITVDTLAGDAEAKFAVKSDLFGQLKLPLAFTDGDTAQVQASVHNDLLDQGEIDVALKVTLGGKSTTVTKKLKVEKKGIAEVNFDHELQLPDDAPRDGGPALLAEFELTVKSGERSDTVKRSVPVHPYGVPVYSIEGGSASGDVTVLVAPPKDMKLVSPRLQVILGPNVEQSLLDALFAPATWCQTDSSRLATGSDTAASDLLAALALQQLIGKTRDANHPQAAEIDARIRAAVSLLISAQHDDGGWSWGGKSGASNRYTSSRVLWALSLAKAAGYRVAAGEFNQAQAFVQGQLSAAAAADFETRAVLLFALTASGKEDVTLVNQLYRNRQSLSPMGVVHLALTYLQMDRKQTAAEVLTLLDKHDFNEAAPARQRLAWTESGTELRALYALALEQISPADAKLAVQIEWLMAHRTGHRWSPDKATGPAMLALGRWYGRTKFQNEKYKLSIYVNDLLAQEVEVTPDTRTQTIDIPAKFLKLDQPAKPEQRVRLELGGRGRFTYQCVLGGFVPAEQLKPTTATWRVDRVYDPAPLELYGEAVPRGFDILAGQYQPFRNELTELPVAKRTQVKVRVMRPGLRPGTADEELEYLVVTEPIPAGATVIENTIAGEFERYELAPGAITFYVGARRDTANLSYELHGYLPGKYRATPTIVRNAYRPDLMTVAASKSLAVLGLGAKSADKYRLTPRELYELGKRHFDRGDFDQAAPHLHELFAQWNLGADFYKETARMLLDISLTQKKPAEIVKFFEIIIEKFPDVEISFDKYMLAGEAYHQIGEYERSYLVFRAVIEASFLRESRVAGFLQDQGEFLRSVDVMSKLLGEYPAEPYVASAAYALAQNIYAKAPDAAQDAKLREKRINRVDLIRQAWQRMDAFLAENPNDPAADQASFSLANALLDLELFDKAIERCQKYSTRYAGSDYLDSYWYIVGYCHYARGEHKQALEMCAKVAEATRVEKGTGRKIESPNKWRAIYILGQIYHSLGQAEAAIREYTRVQDRFEDAREAIEFFAQKGLKLPEVATVKPGEPAQLELKYRNVPAVDVVVYRIDLMKFSLLRRSLAEITQVNLAGIRPIHEEKVDLGDGKDFKEKTHALKLPVKEEGAYLVVCRGENLYATSMLVVSPLVAEVQEEAAAGRVRTTIRDVVKDQYLHDVHVKVIGSRNGDFISGDTDLRGIHVADGIKGTSMVIAQASGGRYAFYRGQRDLGPPPQPAPNAAPQADAPSEGKPSAKGGKEALLDDLKTFNKSIQMEQQKNLFDNFYNNSIEKGFDGGRLKK